MQSKKFRNKSFVVGDLVEPNWNIKEPYGFGIVYDIKELENKILIYWQLKGSCIEHATDVKLVQQVLD